MQTAFEVFKISQKENMINELLENQSVKDCSFDFNGNHVVQKIVSQMGQQANSAAMKGFVQQIEAYILDYSVHEYCCRIV